MILAVWFGFFLFFVFIFQQQVQGLVGAIQASETAPQTNRETNTHIFIEINSVSTLNQVTVALFIIGTEDAPLTVQVLMLKGYVFFCVQYYAVCGAGSVSSNTVGEERRRRQGRCMSWLSRLLVRKQSPIFCFLCGFFFKCVGAVWKHAK